MEGGWLARARWRRSGAWLRPAFVGLTVLDAYIGTRLPVSGDSASFPGVLIAAVFLNLIAALALTLPLGALIRRRRPDLPTVVARDRAGTSAVVLVTVALLALGLVHRPAIQADRTALRDAIVRAMAFIGDRAPQQFRVNMSHPDTFTIQPTSVYRVCVPNGPRTQTYCVVVRPHMPFAQSVTFAGYEPNGIFAQGTN
jgi:hypothetical protein